MARGNNVVMTGNLTGDPKFHTFDSGKTKATVQIAVNEDRKNDDGSWTSIPHYFEWDIWAGGVTVIRKFQKGHLVTLYGRASWRKWEAKGDSPGGEKVSFVAEAVFGDHMYDKSDGPAPQQQRDQSSAPRTRGDGAGSDQNSQARTRDDQPQPDAVPAGLNEAGDPADDDVPWQ